MNLSQLNSFDNFVDDSTLTLEDRIHRDLLNYLVTQIGHALYSRSEGAALAKMENDSNIAMADALLKTQIVQAVGLYNMQVLAMYRVICGSDYIDITRNGSDIDILVVFLPMQKPQIDNLNYLNFSIPSFSGG